MENPAFHPKWRAEIDTALANPATHVQVQRIVDEATAEHTRDLASGLIGASALAYQHRALVAAGYIKP